MDNLLRLAVTSDIITLNPAEWEIQSSKVNSLSNEKKRNLMLHQLQYMQMKKINQARLTFRSKKGLFKPQLIQRATSLKRNWAFRYIFSQWTSEQVPRTCQFFQITILTFQRRVTSLTETAPCMKVSSFKGVSKSCWPSENQSLCCKSKVWLQYTALDSRIFHIPIDDGDKER